MEHLGDDPGARGVVCKADDGHGTVCKPHAGAEQRIGDAEDGREECHAKPFVREERDAFFVRRDGIVGAGEGVETVPETFEKRISVLADACRAVPARAGAEIVMSVPVVAEGGDLRGRQHPARLGILVDPVSVPVRVRDGEFTPGKVLVAPVEYGRGAVQQFLRRLRGLARPAGGGHVDFIQPVAGEPPRECLRLTFTERGQLIGVVDGLSVADVKQQHDRSFRNDGFATGKGDDDRQG